MILTCPECATRYLTKPEAIGSQGRTVRCASCSATWFVKPDLDILDLSSQPDVVAKTAAGDFGAVPAGGPSLAYGDEIAIQFRDNAGRKRGLRRWISVGFIWIVTLAVIVLAALLAYLFRQPMVERFPAAATVYKALDIEVAEGGLLFGDVITRSAYIEGELTVIAEGVIRNPTQSAIPISPIVFTLSSPGGKALTQWTLTPGSEALPELTLAPQEALSFLTQYASPPIDASILSYQFSAGDFAGHLSMPSLDSVDTYASALTTRPVLGGTAQSALRNAGQ